MRISHSITTILNRKPQMSMYSKLHIYYFSCSIPSHKPEKTSQIGIMTHEKLNNGMILPEHDE
jgi:hypothetical protein